MDKTAVKQWWQWFGENASELGARDTLAARQLIDERLSTLHASLSCEVGSDRGGPQLLLVVSDETLRDLPETLLAACPGIADWKFSSWRVERPVEGASRLSGGLMLPDESVTFELARRVGQPWLDATVACSELEPHDEAVRQAVAGQLLDEILGERLRHEAIETLTVRTGPAGSLRRDSLPAALQRELSRDDIGSVDTLLPDWSMVRGELDGEPIVGQLMGDVQPALMGSLPWHLEVELAAGLDGFLTKDDVESLDGRENAVLETAEYAATALFQWGTFTHAGARKIHAQLDGVAGVREALDELHNGAETSIRFDPRWRAYRAHI